MRALVVAAAALVATAGCSDDGNGDAGPSTTAEPVTSATARPQQPRPTSPTTTTCPPDGEDTDPLVASTDLDGDGIAERWRVVGAGAAADIVELRRVEGCTERAVRFDGGTTAQFAVGGTVTLLQGVACRGRLVVHLGATSEDGERYTTLDITYELEGDILVQVDEQTGELDASDPALRDYSGFRC